MTSTKELDESITAFVHELQVYTRRIKQVVECVNLQRVPLQHGFFKVNIDGTMDVNTINTTIGGIIRDCYRLRKSSFVKRKKNGQYKNFV